MTKKTTEKKPVVKKKTDKAAAKKTAAKSVTVSKSVGDECILMQEINGAEINDIAEITAETQTKFAVKMITGKKHGKKFKVFKTQVELIAS